MSNTEALRAALAQALAALATCNSNEGDDPWFDHEKVYAARETARAALAQTAASGEPVAWHMRVIGCDGSADWCELGAKPPEPVQGVEALPMMYAKPAAPDAQKGAA